MKRIAVVLAVCLLPVGGYYLLLSNLVTADAGRERVRTELAAWTGRDISFSENAEVRLFPAPRLILHDLRVSGPADDRATAILTASTLQADISLLPLMIGKIGFSAISLMKPDIRLRLDGKGKPNWRIDGAPAAIQLALAGDLPFDQLALTDATITFQDDRRDRQETLTIADFNLDWEGIRQPASVRALVMMRDETIGIDARISNPLAFLERKSTALTASLDGEMLRARLTGQLADYKATRFTGELDADGPSLARLAGFLDGSRSTGPDPGSFSLTGQADIKPSELFIDRGEVRLGTNIATGNLSITYGKVPVLGGTLAFPTLNLSPYLGMFGGAHTHAWSDREIDTNWFGNLDADLRISADQVVAGPYSIDNVAASAILNGSALEIGLAQSSFYDGIASGNISVTDLAGREGQEIGVQLRVAEFNLGQAVRLAGSPSDLGGSATMSIDLQSKGRTLGQLMGRVSGPLSLLAHDGGAPDLGLGAAADALAAGKSLNGISHGGLSFYQRLAVSGAIKGGNLVLDDLSVASFAYLARLKGILVLANREVVLTGTMSGSAGGEPNGRVEIRGPVASPMIVMTPDQ